MQKINNELKIGFKAFFYGLYSTLGGLCLIILLLTIYPFYWVLKKE